MSRTAPAAKAAGPLVSLPPPVSENARLTWREPPTFLDRLGELAQSVHKAVAAGALGIATLGRGNVPGVPVSAVPRCASEVASPDAATIAAALQDRFASRPTAGEVRIDDAAVGRLATDFGRAERACAQVVVYAKSTEDVRDVMLTANELGVRVTPRGNGGNTEGQTVSGSGIMLDVRGLDSITYGVTADGGHEATIGSGTTWARVADDTRRMGYEHGGLQVPVMTGYKNLTVGGTLSVGGGGYRSHSRGLQVDHVTEIEIVTGAGKIVYASPTNQPDLFYGALGGDGQLGVITHARVPLVPDELGEGKKLASYDLTYADQSAFLADLLNPALADTFYEVQGNAKPTKDGWKYIIKGSVDSHEISQSELQKRYPSASLDRKAHVLFRSGRSAQLESFVYDAGMKIVGRWDTPHPWGNTYLPLNETADFFAEQLSQVDKEGLGKFGFVSLVPTVNNQRPYTYLQIPEGPSFGSYGIFYMPPDDGSAPALWQQLDEMQSAANEVGGKSYTSDTLPKTAADWQAYFGANVDAVRGAKAKFDPKDVLQPVNEGQARFWSG